MGPAKEISGHRKGVSDSHNNTMLFLFSEFDTQWLIHQELVMGPPVSGFSRLVCLTWAIRGLHTVHGCKHVGVCYSGLEGARACPFLNFG
jgi:hypothetical protein